MYNVRVKCRETLYPDIGTLYPSVNKILDAFDISQNKGETWYFVIWYNNSKNLEADIELKTDSQGNKVINTTYLDEKEVQFTPPWKKRADSLMKIPDTAIHHYHPNQHF